LSVAVCQFSDQKEHNDRSAKPDFVAWQVNGVLSIATKIDSVSRSVDNHRNFPLYISALLRS